MRGDDRRAGRGDERGFQGRGGGRGIVDGEDEYRRLFADAEGLEPAAQLDRVHQAAERPGEHVARQPSLGLAGDPPAHQLERDDRHRLLQDQPLEVPQAAGVADDHHPRLRRPAARRDHRMGQRPPGERGMRGHERVPVAGVPGDLAADAADRLGGELAAEAAPGEALAAAVEDRHRAAHRGGDGSGDLLQPAFLQYQPLEPPLDRQPALQHLVLLVDEAGERLLGDRDERGRVGDLEEREGALAGLVDERLGQPLMAEAGAEAEPRQVAVGEVGDEGALLVVGVERDAGGQHQLPARQPRRRVLQLGDVDPADWRRGLLGPGRQFQIELVEEALDREHTVSLSGYATRCSQASVRTPRQDVVDFFELLGVGDQRRGELDHRVAAVVGAADQARACRARRRGSRAAASPTPRR